jgi:hypothetical protein
MTPQETWHSAELAEARQTFCALVADGDTLAAFDLAVSRLKVWSKIVAERQAGRRFDATASACVRGVTASAAALLASLWMRSGRGLVGLWRVTMRDGYDNAEFWLSQARRAEMRGRMAEAQEHRAHAAALRRKAALTDFAAMLGAVAVLYAGCLLVSALT